MDPIGTITSTQRAGQTSGQSSSTSGRGLNELTSEDFTQLIITELTKQDPLQPNDTNALLNQIATIRSIESDTNLSDSLSGLVRQNDFSSAATLIGKSVSGVSTDNRRVSGVVESIARTREGTSVRLESGETMAWANVDRVQQ
jgi:flagellar basal-body rod modification protein FlgD